MYVFRVKQEKHQHFFFSFFVLKQIVNMSCDLGHLCSLIFSTVLIHSCGQGSSCSDVPVHRLIKVGVAYICGKGPLLILCHFCLQ